MPVKESMNMEELDGFEAESVSKPARFAPPRRDTPALGFGVGFLALGLLGLLRAGGVPLPLAWLYAAVLVGLGAAGLVSARVR
jgi:hypothetical protein